MLAVLNGDIPYYRYRHLSHYDPNCDGVYGQVCLDILEKGKKLSLTYRNPPDTAISQHEKNIKIYKIFWFFYLQSASISYIL